MSSIKTFMGMKIVVRSVLTAQHRKVRGTAHRVYNLGYKIPKEIRVIFNDCCNCDYHFIIKDSTEEFEGHFENFRKSSEEHITFSVPIKKENKNGKAIT